MCTGLSIPRGEGVKLVSGSADARSRMCGASCVNLRWRGAAHTQVLRMLSRRSRAAEPRASKTMEIERYLHHTHLLKAHDPHCRICNSEPSDFNGARCRPRCRDAHADRSSRRPLSLTHLSLGCKFLARAAARRSSVASCGVSVSVRRKLRANRSIEVSLSSASPVSWRSARGARWVEPPTAHVCAQAEQGGIGAGVAAAGDAVVATASSRTSGQPEEEAPRRSRRTAPDVCARRCDVSCQSLERYFLVARSNLKP